MKKPLHRLLASWTLCLLLLSWGAEAAGAHACPHHARIGSGEVGAASAHGHHHADTPAPDEAEGHQACTCASGCPSSASGLLPRIVEIPAASITAFAPVDGGHPRDTRPRHPQPHVLPYAQAPPVG